MKKTRLILVSLLCAAMLALVPSCSGSSEAPDQKLELLSEAEAVDLSGYTLMRSDFADDEMVKAAVAMRKALKDKLGMDFELNTDWVKRGAEIPTDTSEIIIGSTNRREFETLRKQDFRIVRDKNRIFIVGGSAEATMKAVEYFAENCLSSKGSLLADGTDYLVVGDYKVGTLKLGSTVVDVLKFYHKLSGTSTTANADKIVAKLTEVTGMNVEVLSSAEGANIILDERDGSLLKNGDWGTVTEEGKLTIVGDTDIERRKAVKSFLEKLDSATGELTFELGEVSEKQQTKEEYYQMKQLVIYPEFPKEIVRDYTYSVSVTQGSKTEKIPVYNHTMESTVSRNADGADNFRRFSSFAFSGEQVRVDVKVNCDFTSYSVMPSAKSFKHEFKDGVISVYLDEPDYFLIRLDNSDNTIISVLADYPEFPDEVDFDDPDTIKIEGWFEPEDGSGSYTISEPNKTLYIAPGAVLNARVSIKGDNCRVLGRGAIVDPYEDIYNYDIRVGGNEGKGTKMLTINGANCIADGVHLLDSRCFNAAINSRENVTVRNLKILSSMMTTDGISIYWGDNHVAEHCFVYCGDNVMVYSANGTLYKDITSGTTCATLFPQGDPKNVTFDGIYIFRTDDGVINHRYNGTTPGTSERSASSVIKNLDAVDCTFMPWFFQARNMGSKLDKVFELENISLGSTSKLKTNHILLFQNGSSYLFSEKWDIAMTNLAIDGKVITSIDQIKITEPNDVSNKYSVKSEGSFTPVVHSEKTVNYKAANKVFIGSWQVFFAEPVLVEGGVFYLPAEQTKYELRTDELAKTVEKNGIKYVSANDLVSSGMAKKVETKDGSLLITPVNDGENLLLADSGELSRFTEATCYELHMYTTETDEGMVYTVENTKMTLNSGIMRLINEDIYKYGEGTYKLSFKAKAGEAGKIRSQVSFKSNDTQLKDSAITTDWQGYSFEFKIDSKSVKDTKIAFCVKSADKALTEFSLRDISLAKVSG